MQEIQKLLRIASNKVGAQKSDEWLEWRQDKVTGTDMAKLFSKSGNHEELQDLLIKKSGFERNKFLGNEMTDHGNYYEDIAVDKYEKLTGNKVHLFNGIEHKTCKHLGCSPDGIVFLENDDGDKTDETILIEVKCPWSRKINETISTVYKFQCQTGMEIINSWGAENVKTHFVQFKPENWGKYSKNQIVSINVLERDAELGKQMPGKAEDFFKWVYENETEDFDGFIDENEY